MAAVNNNGLMLNFSSEDILERLGVSDGCNTAQWACAPVFIRKSLERQGDTDGCYKAGWEKY